jgi:patatin-like phospholipase/acyl hydrolase
LLPNSDTEENGYLAKEGVSIPMELAPSRRVPVVALSIDGGGIRGLIPAHLFTQIEFKTGYKMWQLADLIAGTSTGGILALGLSTMDETEQDACFAAHDLLHMYREQGDIVFTPKPFSLGSLARAKYKERPFYQLLSSYFKDSTLSKSMTDVVVTSFDIGRKKPKFFKSYAGAKDPHHDFFRRDVARATSAAPTYFKPAKIFSLPDQYNDRLGIDAIDGGMCANNPALCAFSEALYLYPDATDIIIASFGTGHATVPLRYHDAKKMGAVGWGMQIANITIDGPADVVDYQMNQISKTFSGRVQYFRFQTELQKANAAMDNVSADNLTTLEHRAEEIARTPKFNEFIQLLQSLPLTPERRTLRSRIAEENQ